MKRLLTKFIILIAVAAAICAGTLFYLDWRIPRATATVQVHPAMIVVNSQNPDAGAQITRHYMESEFQTILSKQTRALAATLLKTPDDQMDTMIQRIKENVITSPIRGTDFITITAKDPDRQTAINIANAVVEAYVQNRTAAQEDRVKRALQALNEELVTNETRVTNLWQKVKAAIQEGTIPPFDKEEGETQLLGASSDPRPIYPLKEEYKNARDFAREVKLKQQETRVLLKTPRNPITIHERATLTPSPVPQSNQ